MDGMTRSELIRKLKELVELQSNNVGYRDLEGDHIFVDSLLLLYVNDDEITDLFNDIKKWYAWLVT